MQEKKEAKKEKFCSFRFQFLLVSFLRLYLDGNNEDVSSSAIDDAAGLDGGTVSQAQMTQSWYQSLGFDMNAWEWKDGKLTLKNVGYKRK